MKKWTLAVVVLGVLAACGETGTVEVVEIEPPPSADVSTTRPATTQAPSSESTSAADLTTTTEAATPVVVDGPPAPDFALALDDGRGFILSEEKKPVYMIFWAEW